ncbi:protein LURP-one-related 17 [Euphorbia lathyris]|uniref:protein LURP-one-related 17 n=1 Tax=Euphorbia lathyris TaxID=212925 RepID=UPI0033134D3D
MFLFLKSLSRSVHNDQEPAEDKHIVTGDGTSTSFTVWRKSLLISCNGFTVINSAGDLVYRVDNYSLHPQQLVLMDSSGKSILTMHRRKKFGVSENWEIYEGENCSKMDASIWSVKKKKKIVEVFNKSVVIAYVLRGRQCLYVIEGCYRSRSCKVMDESRRVMAEIKRKETLIGGISFGEDVFNLVVHFGFDSAFAMALVLLLDQMFS